MLDGFTIRSAQPSEGDLLSELAFRSKSFWKYPRDFMEACRAELATSEEDLANPGSCYVVAESRGEVLGYYALARASSGPFELEALFVEPKHIGRGVGRRLIEHAKDRARELGAASILIQGDPNAASFYAAAGAVRVGERESGSIPGRYLPEFRIDLEVEEDASAER